MSLLKWVAQGDYGDEVLETAWCDYEVCRANDDDWYIFFGMNGESETGYRTKAEAKARCERDYIARCSEFLRVAGPGQSVVDDADLARILTWFRGDARTVPHADMDATLERLSAALARWDAAQTGA